MELQPFVHFLLLSKVVCIFIKFFCSLVSQPFYDKKKNNLRKLRTERGLTQQQLADRIGMSRVQVADMERGHKSITSEMAWKLADYFMVSIDYLLGRAEYKEINYGEN